MMEHNTRSNAVGWQFVDNQFAIRSTIVSSSPKPKPVKRITRRTRILNKELKKIAKIKSYSQYVKIKTKVLREVSEDEFVEEDFFEHTSVSKIKSSQESISVPESNNIKLSKTRRKSSKTRHSTNHKPVHEAKISPGADNHSRAKKNLSTILKNLDKTNLEEDELETVNDINGYIDSDDRSLCRVTSELRIPVGNVPLGDSGIDDNSQGNSSPSNHDDGAEFTDDTRGVDRHEEGLDGLPNIFTQANNMPVAEAANEESSFNENETKKLSQSNTVNDAIYKSSNKEGRVEELLQTGIDNDKTEESVLGKEIMEKSLQSDENDDEIEESLPKGDTIKDLSQSNENDYEIEEFLSNRDITKDSSQTEVNDDKIGNTLLKEKAANPLQFHDDDVENYLKEEIADTGGDEIEEPSVKEIVEKLSQSDENNDEIEKISADDESAQNISQFNYVDDDRIDESSTREESIGTSLLSDTNDDSFKKKTQPTITCTEIVTSKYTIIRDESETEMDMENQSSRLETVENNNQLTEFDELSSEAERVGKLKRINLLCSGTDSDSSEEDDEQKQTTVGPVIKLSSQIISDPSDSENSDSLALHISDSEDEQTILTAHCEHQKIEPLRSRGFANKSIKDQIKEQTVVESSLRNEEKAAKEKQRKSSEDEEKMDNAEEKENASPKNHQSEVTEERNDNTSERKKRKDDILYETEENTANSEDEKEMDNTEEEENASPEDHQSEVTEERNDNRSKRKKQKNDILYETQENTANSEDEKEMDNTEEEENASPENHQPEVTEKRNDNRSKRKTRKNEVLYETESLQYVLKNLSRRNYNDEDRVEERLQNTEENLPRPIELNDFVAREELIPLTTSSTITLEDISRIDEEQNDDEDIWLMEIPRSIVTDPGLCGQNIVIEKDEIRIGETNYNVTRKHIEAVSCILRKNNKKKTRYKAVNIRPICSINVRHERTTNEEMIPFKASLLPKSVPFPKNIKSRNPLLVEKKARLSSSENTDPIDGNKKEKQPKVKKRKNSSWNMDNFILKPKRKKIDRSLVSGSKNGDFFNE